MSSSAPRKRRRTRARAAHRRCRRRPNEAVLGERRADPREPRRGRRAAAGAAARAPRRRDEREVGSRGPRRAPRPRRRRVRIAPAPRVVDRAVRATSGRTRRRGQVAHALGLANELEPVRPPEERAAVLERRVEPQRRHGRVTAWRRTRPRTARAAAAGRSRRSGRPPRARSRRARARRGAAARRAGARGGTARAREARRGGGAAGRASGEDQARTREARVARAARRARARHARGEEEPRDLIVHNFVVKAPAVSKHADSERILKLSSPALSLSLSAAPLARRRRARGASHLPLERSPRACR